MNIKFVNKRDLKKLSDKELYSLVGKSRDFADLVLDEYYFRESELIKKINIPCRPDICYGEWTNWYNFLGNKKLDKSNV